MFPKPWVKTSKPHQPGGAVPLLSPQAPPNGRRKKKKPSCSKPAAPEHLFHIMHHLFSIIVVLPPTFLPVHLADCCWKVCRVAKEPRQERQLQQLQHKAKGQMRWGQCCRLLQQRRAGRRMAAWWEEGKDRHLGAVGQTRRDVPAVSSPPD